MCIDMCTHVYVDLRIHAAYSYIYVITPNIHVITYVMRIQIVKDANVCAETDTGTDMCTRMRADIDMCRDVCTDMCVEIWACA